MFKLNSTNLTRTLIGNKAISYKVLKIIKAELLILNNIEKQNTYGRIQLNTLCKSWLYSVHAAIYNLLNGMVNVFTLYSLTIVNNTM